MPRFRFDDDAWNEYVSWQDEDRKTLRKINRLLTELRRANTLSNGIFEKLKYRPDTYSARIDGANRLVLQVKNDLAVIISCKGHYDDK